MNAGNKGRGLLLLHVAAILFTIIHEMTPVHVRPTVVKLVSYTLVISTVAFTYTPFSNIAGGESKSHHVNITIV